MPQIDWLLEKHFSGDHLQRNEIPGLPKAFPFVEGGDVGDGVLGLG